MEGWAEGACLEVPEVSSHVVGVASQLQRQDLVRRHRLRLSRRCLGACRGEDSDTSGTQCGGQADSTTLLIYSCRLAVRQWPVLSVCSVCLPCTLLSVSARAVHQPHTATPHAQQQRTTTLHPTELVQAATRSTRVVRGWEVGREAWSDGRDERTVVVVVSGDARVDAWTVAHDHRASARGHPRLRGWDVLKPESVARGCGWPRTGTGA